MTQSDKELLLKDLCSRLPYGVMIQHPELFRPSIFVTEKLKEYYNGHFGSNGDSIEFTKPYLRPMSSMTEEEDKEWQYYKNAIVESCDERLEERISELHDWFAANHFDYRGLIEKGLALEAPKYMYK